MVPLCCEAALGQIDAEQAPHGDAKRTQVAVESNLEPEPTAVLADVEKNTRAAWRKLGKLDDESGLSLRFDGGGELGERHVQRVNDPAHGVPARGGAGYFDASQRPYG